MHALLVTTLAGLVLLGSANAQSFPTRPVRIVIGFAPGGTPDVFARLIAQRLTEQWGTQVLVENRPGATGNVASEMVAKSAPDGHTLLYCDSAHWAINPFLFAKLPYDPFRDFAPVIHTNYLPTYVTVHPSVPVTTIRELIAHAKANPGKLAYASAGNGSIHHLTTELFKSMAGIDMVHIPYKGAAPGTQALVAGDVQVAFVSYTAMSPFVTAGKARILAISTQERSQALPNTPTIAESGVPGFDLASALGALAPAGTPRDIVQRLNAGFAAAIAHPEVAAKMTGFGVVTVTGSTPEQFGALMRAEHGKYEKLVKASGARMD
jgi:tripartite-type tricarboxylate transporter receptor subunit TctC